MEGHALPPVDHEETTGDVVPVAALMRGLAMIVRLGQGARPRSSMVTIEELADEMVPPTLPLRQTVQPFAQILRRQHWHRRKDRRRQTAPPAAAVKETARRQKSSGRAATRQWMSHPRLPWKLQSQTPAHRLRRTERLSSPKRHNRESAEQRWTAMERRLEEARAKFRRAAALEETVLREWDVYVATTPTLPQGARRWITPRGKRREELAAVAKVRAAPCR